MTAGLGVAETERSARTRAESELAEAQRAIRERDERVLSLCHSLQTPLSVVLMRSEMLLSRPADRNAMEHGLHSIWGAARMQAAIIENVVEWSRMIEGEREMVPVAVDLASCVQDVLDRFAYQTRERKVTMRAHVEPGDWKVWGDPARLTLAIHNLVGNAVKFTPSGGSVDVTLERGERTASVRVSDTGPGFSPEAHAHLFEPHPVGDAHVPYRGRSLGLGLPVVKWIAQIHGGTTSATSAGPSRGSSFVLTIPVVATDQTPKK